MNTCKRLLAFALALVLTLSCLPAQHIHVSAAEEQTVSEDIIATGSCGLYADWALSDDGTLTISGEGSTLSPSTNTMAFREEYRSSVTKVVVEGGITQLATELFSDLENLSAVVWRKVF